MAVGCRVMMKILTRSVKSDTSQIREYHVPMIESRIHDPLTVGEGIIKQFEEAVEHIRRAIKPEFYLHYTDAQGFETSRHVIAKNVDVTEAAMMKALEGYTYDSLQTIVKILFVEGLIYEPGPREPKLTIETAPTMRMPIPPAALTRSREDADDAL